MPSPVPAGRPQGQFQARTGSGSQMFVHGLDFDEGGSATHFCDVGRLSGTASAADKDRGEAALVMSGYLSICGKVGGAHRHALNDELQHLHAAPCQATIRSDFWVQRQAVTKKLYAAAFPAIQRLASSSSSSTAPTDGSESPATSVSDLASTSSAGGGNGEFAVYVGPSAQEKGRAANACRADAADAKGARQEWGRRLYLDASTGLVFHIWTCSVAARAFVTAASRLWQLLFEHRLGAGGLVAAPVVALVSYRGLFITAMPLVPVNPSDPATVLTVPTGGEVGDSAALSAAFLSTVRDLIHQPTPSESAVTVLRTFAEHGSAAAKVLMDGGGGPALLAGRDGRYYLVGHFTAPPLAAVPHSAKGRRVLLRPEVLPYIRRADGRLVNTAAKGPHDAALPPLGQCSADQIGTAICELALPAALGAMREDLATLVQDGGAAKDGGLQTVLTKLATSEQFVVRGLRSCGVNMVFLGAAMAQVEAMASKEGTPLDGPGPAPSEGGLTESDISRGILRTIRDALAFEMAVRAVKHIVRGELTFLQDRSSFHATPALLVDHIHRVMALAANDHAGFWLQLNRLVAEKYALGPKETRPDGRPWVPFSLQLVKILTWHLTPKLGLGFEQAAGRFSTKFACVSLATGFFAAPDLMRLTASGNTAAVADAVTREWDCIAAPPDGGKPPPHLVPLLRALHPADASLALQLSSGGFGELDAAALSHSGAEVVPVASVANLTQAQLAYRVLYLLRAAYLEELVRWTNKMPRRHDELHKVTTEVTQRQPVAAAAILTAQLYDLADAPEKRAAWAGVLQAHLDALEQLLVTTQDDALSDAERQFTRFFVANRYRLVGNVTDNALMLREALALLRTVPAHATFGCRITLATAADALNQAAAALGLPTAAKDAARSAAVAAADALDSMARIAGNGHIIGLPRPGDINCAVLAGVVKLLLAASTGKQLKELPADALDRIAGWLMPVLTGATTLGEQAASDKNRGLCALGLVAIVACSFGCQPALLCDRDITTSRGELTDFRQGLLAASLKTETAHDVTFGNPAFVARLDALTSLLMCPHNPPAAAKKAKSGSRHGSPPPQALPASVSDSMKRSVALRLRVSLPVAYILRRIGGSRIGCVDFFSQFVAASTKVQEWIWRRWHRRVCGLPAMSGLLRLDGAVPSSSSRPAANSDAFVAKLLTNRAEHVHVKPLAAQLVARFEAATVGGYGRGLWIQAFGVVFPRMGREFEAQREVILRAGLRAEEAIEFQSTIQGPLLLANASGARSRLDADEASARWSLEAVESLVEIDEPRGRLWIASVEAASAVSAISRGCVELAAFVCRWSMEAQQLEAAALTFAEATFAAAVAQLEAEADRFHAASVESTEASTRFALATSELTTRDEVVREAVSHEWSLTIDAQGHPWQRRTVAMQESRARHHALELAETVERESLLRSAVQAAAALEFTEHTSSNRDRSALLQCASEEATLRAGIVLAVTATYCGIDEGAAAPTFLAWSRAAFAATVLPEMRQSERSILEALESVWRAAVAEAESEAHGAMVTTHQRATLGIALDRLVTEADRVKDAAAVDEAARRRELLADMCEAHRALTIERDEMRSALVFATLMEHSARGVCAAHLGTQHAMVLAECSAVTAWDVMTASEQAARRLLLGRLHKGAAGSYWRNQVRWLLAQCSTRYEEMHRSIVAEQEAGARLVLQQASTAGASGVMATELLFHAEKARRVIDKTEFGDRAAMMLLAVRNVSNALWCESLGEARTTVLESSADSVRDAMVRAERRVLLSEYKLLVIADRQAMMRAEHDAFALLRLLRDFLSDEADTRAALEAKEATAREVVAVQEVVWRGGGDGTARLGVAAAAAALLSPWRTRALAKVPVHPNAIRNRNRMSEKRQQVAAPRWETEQPPPTLPWLDEGFAPAPIAERTREAQAERLGPTLITPTKPTRLTAALEASRAAESPQHNSPKRIGALIAADVDRLTAAIADISVTEDESRDAVFAMEAKARRGIATAWTVAVADLVSATRLTGVTRAHGRAVEADEAKRREAVEFERERDVVLLTVARREAVFGAPPAPGRRQPPPAASAPKPSGPGRERTSNRLVPLPPRPTRK
jgi:hypothetical protein